MDINTPRYTKTSCWQKITLIIFGLFLTLVLIETGLRLGGFVLSSLQEYRNRISISKKGAYHIMCLGESTTARQYPSFLEETLNQRNIGIKFSVIDKGILAVNTSCILAQLESNLNEYHPHMVVTMMGINDSGDHLPYEAVSNSKIICLFRSFRTYNLARLLWLHILTKAKEMGFSKSHKDRQPVKRLQSNLLNIGLKESYTEEINSYEASLKKAIDLNPKNDDAYTRLGWFYRDQGTHSQVEDSFKKAIELNPKNDGAYVGLGWLYQTQGKLSQAEDSFKKAIELNPKNDGAYVGLGWVYQKQDKFPQAEDSFKKAIDLNPKNDVAYTKLGGLYQAQGKFPQAEDSFKKAIELNPRRDWAYSELGWLYQAQGKFPQAEEAFKKIIELNPQNDRAPGALSLLYQEMGKSELAKEYNKKTKGLRLGYYNPVTTNNYHKLKEILDKRGIRLVCVQYPMRSLGPLKNIFQGNEEGVIFVDNEKIFKEALEKEGYKEYFIDMFGGDFGHCAKKGKRLLATNIADVILKEVFHK